MYGLRSGRKKRSGTCASTGSPSPGTRPRAPCRHHANPKTVTGKQANPGLKTPAPEGGYANSRSPGAGARLCAGDVPARRKQWLVLTFAALPIPADVAISRAEQLLQAASGNPWAEAEILAPLSQLYAYRAGSPMPGPRSHALSPCMADLGPSSIGR